MGGLKTTLYIPKPPARLPLAPVGKRKTIHVSPARSPFTVPTALSRLAIVIQIRVNNIYKRTNVMQLGRMFICNCNIALHVSDAFCVHLQEHLEIVEAASGE